MTPLDLRLACMASLLSLSTSTTLAGELLPLPSAFAVEQCSESQRIPVTLIYRDAVRLGFGGGCTFNEIDEYILHGNVRFRINAICSIDEGMQEPAIFEAEMLESGVSLEPKILGEGMLFFVLYNHVNHRWIFDKRCDGIPATYD